MGSETQVSESIVLDMEIFTHQADKDITSNARINLQRSLSRKGSQRGAGEKKMNFGIGGERDRSVIATSSPRAAALAGDSTPEKSMPVTMGATNNGVNPQVQHQITIMTGNISSSVTTAESKWSGKRPSFKRSPPSASWASINPRQILLFFATLSSMGTILLIYFTLSVGKIGGDNKALDS